MFSRVLSRFHPRPAVASALIFGTTALFTTGIVGARRLLRVVIVPREAWQTLCHSLQIPDEVAQAWWKRVDRHYSEPQRYYHTMAHIAHMLNTQHAHRSLVTKPATCQLATFFHDIIYDPKSGTNEEDSAKLFQVFAKEALSAITANQDGAKTATTIPKTFTSVDGEVVDPREVYHYIICTKSHTPPPEADVNLRLFLDFDMAILGTPWEEYAQYAAHIRNEYIHFPQYDYCRGRAAVLEKFLQSPVFASKPFVSKYEYQARKNIKREVACLKQNNLVRPNK